MHLSVANYKAGKLKVIAIKKKYTWHRSVLTVAYFCLMYKDGCIKRMAMVDNIEFKYLKLVILLPLNLLLILLSDEWIITVLMLFFFFKSKPFNLSERG